MRRIASVPRVHWQEKVEEAGLIWHSGEQPYWNESAFYEFTAKEVEILESSTNELAKMTLDAVQYVIDHKLYPKMTIPDSAIPLIENSWNTEPPSLYGRFDLAFDGVHPPKLLEYNADTPTSLLEAAVVQWYWLQDVSPARDQFNSIHERLIEQWKELTPYLPDARVDFCSMDNAEDGMTVTYLLDTAQQAGLVSDLFPVEEIGWDGKMFLGPNQQRLRSVFKLYPWEWMMREEFGQHLRKADTIWIEPPWKMVLSNKGILPVLWELYPGHPNLLEASFDGPGCMDAWVRKPLLGREGANVTVCGSGVNFETAGEYGDDGFIFQQFAPRNTFDEMHAVIGSWVIGHGEASAAGIGIRESETPVTTNTSQFVPHLFD